MALRKPRQHLRRGHCSGCYNAVMSASRPLADSPWFWVYLFGIAALIALALAGPKFGERQAQIEREYQGRTRAAQNLNGAEPDVPLSTSERTLITLRPLFLALAAITAVGWIVHWWTRRVQWTQRHSRTSDVVLNPEHGTPQRAFPTALPTPDQRPPTPDPPCGSSTLRSTSC